MSQNSPVISIVSPVYGAEGLVDTLCDRLEKSLAQIGESYEIILVEDGSPDQSWLEMQGAAAKYAHLRIVRLSRNFGQHHAISAGLDLANGDWVVVMDCDLQDRPEELPQLWEAAQGREVDYVLARRVQRQDNFVKKSLSRLFAWALGKLTGTQHDHTVANFGIYHHSVITAVQSLRESIRFFPLQVKWVGFRAAHVDVSHGDREIGETSYTFWKAFHLAMDVMLSFSDKPLRLAIRAGTYIALVGMTMAGIWVVRTFLAGTATGQGWLSLMSSLWILSGLIIAVLGMVGLYVGKTFDQVKQRPIYIIAEEQSSGDL